MKELFEKIGAYQIVTNLLPGAFMQIMLRVITGISFQNEDLGEGIIICYFTGLILGRIGSLIVEPILKKIKVLNKTPYQDYLKAEGKDERLGTLTESNNMYRSLLTSVICLPVIECFIFLSKNVEWVNKGWKHIIVVFLILIFLLSYRKQTKYISERVEKFNRTVDEPK